MTNKSDIYPFFKVLCDGAGFVVLRAPVVRAPALRAPVLRACVHDFVIVFDEDRDLRIVDAVHRLFFSGLLCDVVGLAECKGSLDFQLCPGIDTEDWQRRAEPVGQPADGDFWAYSQGYGALPDLKPFHAIWDLGIKDFTDA